MARRARTKPCPFMIAKINGAAAGYIISEAIYDEAYVPYIATHPDFQKRGVVKHLMLAAIKKAREERLANMHLEYRGNREHLKKFYESTIPSLAGCLVTTMKVGRYMNCDPKVSVKYVL